MSEQNASESTQGTTLLEILSSIPAEDLVEGAIVYVTRLDGTGCAIKVGARIPSASEGGGA